MTSPASLTKFVSSDSDEYEDASAETPGDAKDLSPGYTNRLSVLLGGAVRVEYKDKEDSMGNADSRGKGEKGKHKKHAEQQKEGAEKADFSTVEYEDSRLANIAGEEGSRPAKRTSSFGKKSKAAKVKEAAKRRSDASTASDTSGSEKSGGSGGGKFWSRGKKSESSPSQQRSKEGDAVKKEQTKMSPIHDAKEPQDETDRANLERKSSVQGTTVPWYLGGGSSATAQPKPMKAAKKEARKAESEDDLSDYEDAGDANVTSGTVGGLVRSPSAGLSLLMKTSAGLTEQVEAQIQKEKAAEVTKPTRPDSLEGKTSKGGGTLESATGKKHKTVPTPAYTVTSTRRFSSPRVSPASSPVAKQRKFPVSTSSPQLSRKLESSASVDGERSRKEDAAKGDMGKVARSKSMDPARKEQSNATFSEKKRTLALDGESFEKKDEDGDYVTPPEKFNGQDNYSAEFVIKREDSADTKINQVAQKLDTLEQEMQKSSEKLTSQIQIDSAEQRGTKTGDVPSSDSDAGDSMTGKKKMKPEPLTLTRSASPSPQLKKGVALGPQPWVSSMERLNQILSMSEKQVPDVRKKEKFLGKMLVEWLMPADHEEFGPDAMELDLALQFCNRLLAVGILQPLEQTSAQTEFNPETTYCWYHHAALQGTNGLNSPSAAPGRITPVWPPPKPESKDGLKYTEAEHQYAVMTLKRENKDYIEQLHQKHELAVFQLRGENAVKVTKLEAEVANLIDQIQDLKKLCRQKDRRWMLELRRPSTRPVLQVSATATKSQATCTSEDGIIKDLSSGGAAVPTAVIMEGTPAPLPTPPGAVARTPPPAPQPPPPPGQLSGLPFQTPVSVAKLLDSKRSQQVGILMSSLHAEMADIENAVLNMDTTHLDLENLNALYDIRPQSEELDKIKRHLVAKVDTPLDKPEQFLYELSNIPSFGDRVFCFTFQSQFQESILTIRQRLDNFKNVCKCLGTGNRTRGQADGFQLEILAKLKDVKGKDGKTSLLHYLVIYFINNFDKAAGTEHAKLPIPEPNDINQATLVKFDDIGKDLRKLKRDIDGCEKKVAEVVNSSEDKYIQPFKDNMEIFIKKAQKEHKEQEDNLDSCQK
ncbi:PREDICTED: uncharacterized protein LOC109483685, partial [Branchiostoma belcheri]|uniref:Uncharacterized protein LOC109483685 n=1 Tax=Branchiostoma belcheri TaxID=7741 RepID=A0A6P4ZM45_BRABE